MKNTFTLFVLLLFLVSFYQEATAQRKKSRYIRGFEVKSSVAPIYRFSRRSIFYELKDLDIPFTSKNINLVLDNNRQNSTFDLLSTVHMRAYFLNLSYSNGAGYFDKHLITKLIRLRNGDYLGLLDKTNANHSFDLGINYLGIRQMFKRVPIQDFHFNVSVNYTVSLDFSDRLSMEQYIDIFEYQNLPEIVVRNQKYFEQVQDFILDKYSLPNVPLYKGFSINAEIGYRRFLIFSQLTYVENILNTKVTSFYIGGKILLNSNR